ncbi:MAG: Asp-tRNA(Asn)/Glu-tRNA(Gln) amidotransferase subunit GatC [Thiopseudomonas sp.]|nr:Asp-tRNA(Asn)/Glu-tRNA(Gln) amidotransferase subunit GatC [Gammaproteobacteria bacterium]
MALTPDDLNSLARLTMLEPAALPALSASLEQAIELAAGIRQADTSGTEPLISPLDLTQRLRADIVSETDQRDCYQQLAPAVQDGLYLVPKVLD